MRARRTAPALSHTAEPAQVPSQPAARVLALQRTAGNRATARLLQRYTKVPASANWGGLNAAMRVSDDGQMAVKDSDVYPEGQGRALQHLYASDPVIAHAKQRLQANASIYDVHRGTALGTTGLYAVEVENKSLHTRGSSVGTLLNCNDNTGQAMGVNDLTPEYGTKPQLAVKLRHKGQEQIHPSAPSSFANDAMVEATKRLADKKDPEKAKTAYGKLDAKKKAERAEKAGVNSAADAHAGEGYGVWAKYGSHFAPVIAESGGDRVTLEAHFQSKAQNFPGLRQGEANWNNPEWYFRMYGPVKRDAKQRVVEDQTFYGEYAAAAAKDNDTTVVVLAFGKLAQQRTLQEIGAEQFKLAKAAGTGLNSAAQWLTSQTYKDRTGVEQAAAQLVKDASTLAADGRNASAVVDAWVTEVEQALATIDATTVPSDNARNVLTNKFGSQLIRLRRFLLQLRHLDEAARTQGRT